MDNYFDPNLLKKDIDTRFYENPKDYRTPMQQINMTPLNPNISSDVSTYGVRTGPANFFQNPGDNVYDVMRQNIRKGTYDNMNDNNSVHYKANVPTREQPFIPSNAYPPPQLLQNNIKDNVIVENTTEHTLTIDGADRDFTAYPNPLAFTVRFNPTNETKAPYIPRNFKNVKYIKLDKVILPNKYKFTTATISPDTISGYLDVNNPSLDTIINAGGTNIIIIDKIVTDASNQKFEFFKPDSTEKETKIYTYDKVLGVLTYTSTELSDKLSDDRFICLNINEFENVHDNSTNTPTSKSFAILYPPDTSRNDFLELNFNKSEKIFKLSELSNLDRMTINFTNSIGDILDLHTDHTSYLRTDVTDFYATLTLTNAEYLTKKNIYDGSGNLRYLSASKYIRHPHYLKRQCFITFKVGIVETDIDKNVFN